MLLAEHIFSFDLHTIKQIIENQKEFRDDIVAFLKKDLSDSLRTLREMKADDPEITESVQQMRARVKNMKTPSISSLFFMSKDKCDHYAWWDADNEEVIIYKYD